MTYFKSLVILLLLQFFVKNDVKNESVFPEPLIHAVNFTASGENVIHQLHCSHLKRTISPFGRATKSFQKRKRKSVPGSFCRLTASSLNIRPTPYSLVEVQFHPSSNYHYYNLPQHRGPPDFT